jgi:hypothetical protein
MPTVTALIKFTQAPNVGIPGQVLLGVVGTTVVVENDNNTDVLSWQIDLVYTPPGSSIPVAVPLAFNNNDPTPTTSFIPDVPGSWRVVMRIWANINRTGLDRDVDIRNFVILLPSGLVLPPYQKDPNRLPTLASGAPGAKPNELNINGTELGWSGDGYDGLLNDLISRNVPPTAIGNPGDVLRISGSTGKVPTLWCCQVLYDGFQSVVVPPGVFGRVFSRVPTDGITVIDRKVQTAAEGITTLGATASRAFTDFALTPANGVGTFVGALVDPGTPESFLVNLNSQPVPTPLSMSLPPLFGPIPDTITSIDYDTTSNHVWTATLIGDVWDVDLAGGSTQYVGLASDITCLRIDQNAANHGGIKRGFISSPTDGMIYRFRVDTGLVDASILLPGPPGGITIGTGTFTGKVFATFGATIRRIDKDLTTFEATSTPLVWEEVRFLDFDSTNEVLWAVGLSSAALSGILTTRNNVVAAALDPGTLAILSIVELDDSGAMVSTGNGGFAFTPPAQVGRVAFAGGVPWIGDPHGDLTGFFDDPSNSAPYQITDPGLAAALISPNQGDGTTTIALPTFTSATSTFVTDGVLPGDVLILTVPATTAVYYEILTVDSQTQLTVTDPNGIYATNALWDFEVYRPYTAVRVAQPGPKSLSFVNGDWQEFTPEYESIDGVATLGDGAVRGRFFKSGGMIDAELIFTRGPTTTFGSDVFFIPLPPDVAFYPQWTGYTSSLPFAAVVSVGVVPTPLPGIAIGLIAFGNWLFLVGLSTVAVVGTPITFRYSFKEYIS